MDSNRMVPKMKNSLFCFLGVLLLIGLQSASAFDITYRYELLEGKDRQICNHMLGVYNAAFRKPWNSEWVQRQLSKTEELGETRYSRQPSSAEFEAIQWRAHPYNINKSPHTALYAEFDIDNDGTNELVIHVGFFDGSPGSRDSIWIFPLGSVSFGEFLTHDDFLRRFAEKRKTVLDHPVHERPFIYQGRTYIHAYDYTPWNFPGANPSEPFGPPEYLTISEYLGNPAKVEGNDKRGGAMKLVCKYNMIQESQR